MTDPAEIVPAEEVWPTPPTLPPPAGPRRRIWFLRFPLWAVVLIDAGFSLADAFTVCLILWVIHHAIQLTVAGISGVMMFVFFLTYHLDFRSRFQKREREQAATAQNATE